MNKKLKRLGSIFLSLIICLSFMPTTAMMVNAEEGPVPPIELKDYITDVNISATLDDTKYESIQAMVDNDKDLQVGDSVKIEVKFGQIDNIEPRAHLVYKLSKVFAIDGTIKKDVMDGQETVGEMTISSDGDVDIDLNDEYVSDNGNSISGGSFAFGASISRFAGTSGERTVEFGKITLDIPVKPIEKRGAVYINKTVGTYDAQNKEIPYTIEVKAPADNDMDVPEVFVKDIFTEGEEYVSQYEVISAPEGKSNPSKGDYELAESARDGLIWNVGTMSAGETAVLKYKVKLADNLDYEFLNNKGLTNKAIAYSESEEKKLGETSKNKKLRDGLKIEKKAGNYTYNKDKKCYELPYSVTVTANSDNLSDMMEDISVEDVFGDNSKYVLDYEVTSDSEVTVDKDKKKLVWTVGKLGRGKSITLKYTVTIDEDILNPNGGSSANKTLRNSAIAYQGDEKNKKELARTDSIKKQFWHEWARKSGEFQYTGAHAGQVKFTLNFNARDISGVLIDEDIKRFSDKLTSEDFVFTGDLELIAYSDKAKRKKVKEEPYIQNIDGNTSWTIDFTDEKVKNFKGPYSYEIVYYAKPIDNEWKGNYSNTYTGEIGIGKGGSFKATSEAVSVLKEGDLTAQISKTAKKGFVEIDGIKTGDASGIVEWKAAIESDVLAGATLTDELRVPDGSKIQHSYTQDLINKIVIMKGKDELKKDDDYSIAFDPEESNKLKVIFNKAIKLSDSEKVTMTYFSLVKLAADDSDSEADDDSEGEKKTISSVGTSAGNKIVFENKFDDEGDSAKGEVSVTHESETGISKTSSGYDASKREIKWRITVNDKNFSSLLNGDFVVKDLLPANLEYVEGSAQIVGADGSKSAASLGEVTVNKNTNGESTVLIPLENVPNGAEETAQVIIELKTKINDPELGRINDYEKEFTNTARVNFGELCMETTGTHTVKSNLLQKELTYDDSTFPYAEYSVNINPENVDLVKGKDTVCLVDEMGEFLQLVPESVKVRGVLDGEDYTPETYSWNSQSRVLKLDVPDDRPLTLSYRVYVTKTPNEKLNLSNAIHFETISNVEDKVEGIVRVWDADVKVSGSVNISFQKTDSEDSRPLAGAEFELFKLSVKEGTENEIEKTSVATLVTGEDGLANTLSKRLAISDVYMYKETKAPEGYKLDDTEHYVYFSAEALKHNPNLERALESNGIELEYYNSGKGYVYTISNTKEDPPTEEPPVPKDSPDTGDTTGILASLMLINLSAIAGLSAITLRRRRRS